MGAFDPARARTISNLPNRPNTPPSELVGLVVIGLVGQPVGFGLVWSRFVIGLVWFGLRLLVLLV